MIREVSIVPAILVNNKKEKASYKVKENDLIELPDNYSEKPDIEATKMDLNIIYEDEDIIVINKPSGLLTIATNKEKEKTLYHIVRDYLVSKDKNNRVFIVHRLDKDTSGIVILAKDEKTKNNLQENWNEYVDLREYVAVVHGKLKKEEDTITQYLKETKTNLVYVYSISAKYSSYKLCFLYHSITLLRIVNI